MSSRHSGHDSYIGGCNSSYSLTTFLTRSFSINSSYSISFFPNSFNLFPIRIILSFGSTKLNRPSSKIEAFNGLSSDNLRAALFVDISSLKFLSAIVLSSMFTICLQYFVDILQYDILSQILYKYFWIHSVLLCTYIYRSIIYSGANTLPSIAVMYNVQYISPLLNYAGLLHDCKYQVVKSRDDLRMRKCSCDMLIDVISYLLIQLQRFSY